MPKPSRYVSLRGRHKLPVTLRVSPRCNQNQRAQQGGTIALRGHRWILAAPCGSSKYHKGRGDSKRKPGNQVSTMIVDCSKYTYTDCACVSPDSILPGSVRRVCLHGGVSSRNGFSVREESCRLGEGKTVPRGMCEYLCSLKSTVPVASVVLHKEHWLCTLLSVD